MNALVARTRTILLAVGVGMSRHLQAEVMSARG